MTVMLCIVCTLGGMFIGFLLASSFGLQRQDDLMEALAHLLESPLDDQVREAARRVLRG